MSTQAPSYPLQKLTTGTDRGVTNAVDAVYVLENLYHHNIQKVMTSNNRIGYTLRSGFEEQQLISSENAGQGLIGRFDNGHRLNFVITVAPRKPKNNETEKSKADDSELQTLHVYFTFPILGTVRVRSTSKLTDDKGDPKKIKFSFGNYLDGWASVKLVKDEETQEITEANVIYSYTAMEKKFDETLAIIPLNVLKLNPFNN